MTLAQQFALALCWLVVGAMWLGVVLTAWWVVCSIIREIRRP